MIGFLKRLLGTKELPPALSYEDARAVLETHQDRLERELAERADAKPEMLYYLAERGAPATRLKVAANPSTPAAANLVLAGDVDPDVRTELARKIGRLLPGLLASERDRVCELTLQTLQRLASDQLTRVRAILAEEIKALDCVPKEIVLSLAHDVEEVVSVAIIEYSPLLADNDLLEIIATARVQNALAAVARRRGLSEKLSEVIVASLDRDAVAALLANPNASIREQTMERIIDHAHSVQSWQKPLAMRSDLSWRALRRVAGFVGAAIIREIMERRGLDEETVQHLQHCLRDRLERDQQTAETKEEKAQSQVAAAEERGAVSERYVEAAVESGQREVVIEALSLLSGSSRASVERVLSSRSAKAVTALVWYAGLSMRVGFKMQTMLLKLPAGELLPARAGVAFPLTEEEMHWHLSYFGVGKK